MMRITASFLAILILSASPAFWAAPGFAQAAPDATTPQFPYRVRRQGLQDVLRFYAERNGLGIVGKSIPSKVIEGPIKARTEEEFLAKVATAGGVDLFAFGGSLYVSPITARATRFVTAEIRSQQELTATLQRMGVPVGDYRVMYDEPTGLISLSGPPGFVELTADILSRIEQPPQEATPPPVQQTGTGVTVMQPRQPQRRMPSVTVFRGESRTVETP